MIRSAFRLGVILLPLPLFCLGSRVPASPVEIKSLVGLIADSDRSIRSWEVHSATYFNETPMVEMDWGYDRGMEYESGTRYLKFPDQKAPRPQTEKWTFDGEKMRGLRDAHAGPRRVVGVIRGLEPENFRGTPNVKTLLGCDLKYEGRMRFGEALLACPNIHLREAPEPVDGHPCLVLELVEADKLTDGRVFDAIVWIDAEREYRVARYEKYISYGGKLRWQVLHERVENTNFQKIDGHWFPIAGKVAFVSNEFQPLPPLRKEDYAKLTPAQVMEKGLTVLQTKTLTYRVIIAAPSVKINHEIPKETFSITFPPGCLVTDDFLKTGYRVGGDIPNNLSAVRVPDGAETEIAPERHESLWKMRGGLFVVGLVAALIALVIAFVVRRLSSRRSV